jgi:hypothetical protein
MAQKQKEWAGMDLTEAKYSWAKIDWEKAERQVRKLQSRIAKAVEKFK